LEGNISGVAHIEFQKLDDRAVVPGGGAYHADAGLDLVTLEDVHIPWGKRADLRTGLAMAMPTGFYGRLVGRSSAIRKRGLLVVEGIIDAGFRGELLVHVYALPQVTGLTLAGEARTLVEAGSSVGQLIVSPIPHVEVYEVDKLPDSERGERGFGSSGR